jgi:CheY-like chemotaxis protein
MDSFRSPASDRRRPGQRQLQVLVAEDNPVNQKVAVLFLQKLGHRADVAANGLEVLSALKRRQYDAILMDVQMPKMDGIQTARLICADRPRDQRPRIVAMTANAMQEDRQACLDAGMDDYISKPVRLSQLQCALEKCTPRSMAARAGAAKTSKRKKRS